MKFTIFLLAFATTSFSVSIPGPNDPRAIFGDSGCYPLYAIPLSRHSFMVLLHLTLTLTKAPTQILVVIKPFACAPTVFAMLDALYHQLMSWSLHISQVYANDCEPPGAYLDSSDSCLPECDY